MNETRTLATLAPAGVTLAAAAPALAIGAAIGLGLLWLFSNDEKPAMADANAKNNDPGREPPARAVPSKSSCWNGWSFWDDEPDAAPTSSHAPETHLARERAEIAREKESIRELKAKTASTRKELERAYSRPVTHLATPSPATSQRPAATQSAQVTATPPRAPAPIVAPRPATPQAVPAVAASVTAAAPVAGSPAVIVPHLATPSPATSQRPAPAQVAPASAPPRKHDRAHLEAVLKAGPLSRAAIVKPLEAAPFSYGNTLAFATLKRFGDSLEETTAGLLAWKPATAGNS